VTTTPAREPIVQAEWLRPGQHITAMGSDAAYKNEIAPGAVARVTRFVCDVISQSYSLGELGPASAADAVDPDRDPVELGKIICGHVRGRINDNDITLCDLTGTGAQDTAIAVHALACAQTENRGLTIAE